MDKRQTFEDYKDLKTILYNISLQKEKASFLIDRDGLSRMEGSISSVEEKTPLAETIIHLDDLKSLRLKEIVGVNGIFHKDYSEC